MAAPYRLIDLWGGAILALPFRMHILYALANHPHRSALFGDVGISGFRQRLGVDPCGLACVWLGIRCCVGNRCGGDDDAQGGREVFWEGFRTSIKTELLGLMGILRLQ